ncbi:phosphoribosyltransferase [Methanolobus chelungpuianus]|uniref:Phosphoribosyltransferase n=1 Tax=Methanolobus chelungpuianus TaxID=502115 RepID=A0AAE3HE91_9EURY|nr:phosphoribosyltransferase family protein [Methanolobus chelungpuianus]MCQ6963733.1 phosphoribosyltransferase [Methanolobus chelungpuianus]
MTFRDRKDAGLKLASRLEKYRGQNVLVLAIPRGGVEVGCIVAEHLRAQFSLLVTRKLPFPDNPEAGFGAIAEDDSVFIFEDAAMWVPSEDIERIVDEQSGEIRRRVQVLRGGRPLPEIGGRTVILVDDGLAMGSTMRASIMLCRKRNAEKIVVAVPVAGREVAEEVSRMVDELVVLEIPARFMAVAQVYMNWYDVSDDEVLEIIDKGCSETEQMEGE